jgi:DNA-directed RNA polymerase sigma subunit (sigma70/sigma32)
MSNGLDEQVWSGLRDVLDDYERMDPWDQLTEATVLNQALHDIEARVAEMRRGAVRLLRGQGYTLKEIGTAAGLTPARVMQLEKGIDRKAKLGR